METFNRGENGRNTRTLHFMGGLRFLQHAGLLSNQKLSLTLDLIFTLLFNCDPPTNFIISPTTVSDWNILLGEADKITLKSMLKHSEFEIHLWGDDSHKGSEERHVFGCHTWDQDRQHPVRYVLGNLLTASGSGRDQAQVEFHTANKVYGITNIGGIIGDNATTQSGKNKGVVAMAKKNFNKETFFVGCYAHVLNILLKRVCYEGFGSKGDMSSFNVLQLHYKVSSSRIYFLLKNRRLNGFLTLVIPKKIETFYPLFYKLLNILEVAILQVFRLGQIKNALFWLHWKKIKVCRGTNFFCFTKQI